MSTQFTTGLIETLDDWNALLVCCCQLPDCPAPESECQTLVAGATSGGYFKTEGSSWVVYARYGTKGTFAEDSSVAVTTGPLSPWNSRTVEIAAEYFYGFAYTHTFQGAVGSGEGCPAFLFEILPVCTSTGTSTVKNYALLSGSTSETEVGHSVVLASQDDTVVADVSGLETRAHETWEVDADAWDEAKDAWETIHPGVTWDEAKTAHDAYMAAVTAHDDWVYNRDNWVADDPENRVPEDYPVTEPEVPPEPENPGDPRPPEPDQTYPECTFRQTTTTTTYHWVYNSYLGDPPGLHEASPPSITVTETHYYGAVTTWPGFSTAGTYIVHANDFEDPQGYEVWIADTRSALLETMVFTPETEPCRGAECYTHFSVTDEPVIIPPDPPEEGEPTPPDPPAPSGTLSIYFSKGRYRWSVPSQIVPGIITEAVPTPAPISWWKGTRLKHTWQVCFFSTEWDAWKILWDAYSAEKAIYDAWVDAGSVVPELPALPPDNPTHPGAQPTAPTLGADLTDEWIGPGDPDDADSWLFPGGWHTLEAPVSNGENRIVNRRFYHTPSSPYGFKPNIIGEGYEPFTIPDP